ncbi:hypothetical protein RRG08_030183 [Elysia crispata]|uniref:Uncharacterized protein n=1 Tax=Elysia crispata TaxID=231223 RepID=A0AAE0ZSE4_9GAST|nr:hypothetical protein RRG08_030183 [Elysia crispata]
MSHIAASGDKREKGNASLFDPAGLFSNSSLYIIKPVKNSGDSFHANFDILVDGKTNHYPYSLLNDRIAFQERVDNQLQTAAITGRSRQDKLRLLHALRDRLLSRDNHGGALEVGHEGQLTLFDAFKNISEPKMLFCVCAACFLLSADSLACNLCALILTTA